MEKDHHQSSFQFVVASWEETGQSQSHVSFLKTFLEIDRNLLSPLAFCVSFLWEMNLKGKIISLLKIYLIK